MFRNSLYSRSALGTVLYMETIDQQTQTFTPAPGQSSKRTWVKPSFRFTSAVLQTIGWGGVVGGVSGGAAGSSLFPVIGSAIGLVVGAVVGLVAGMLLAIPLWAVIAESTTPRRALSDAQAVACGLFILLAVLVIIADSVRGFDFPVLWFLCFYLPPFLTSGSWVAAYVVKEAMTESIREPFLQGHHDPLLGLLWVILASGLPGIMTWLLIFLGE